MTVMELSNGFTEMKADELYFINGGKALHNAIKDAGAAGPAEKEDKPAKEKKEKFTKEDVVYVGARIAAEFVFIGSGNGEIKDDWAKGIAGKPVNVR